jgi:hypothetical protein
VTACPAPAGRPRFDIADIVRQHRAELEADVHLTDAQRRTLTAIALCRTAALGGHLDLCPSCGFERPSYNSCRNRHCPKCQALAQEQWIEARSEQILPVRHFHVVFTLPAQLRPLAQYRPAEVYGVLFRAAGQSLLELGESRLNARLGTSPEMFVPPQCRSRWELALPFCDRNLATASPGRYGLKACN